MSTYYANGDLSAYSSQLADYEAHHQAWQDSVAANTAQYEQAMTAYQERHAEWVANGGIDPVTGDPYPEPQEPPRATDPPEPQPPALPSTVYDARDVEELEEIQTTTGPAIIAPGRVLLTSDGGTTSFSLSHGELDAGYTLTTEPAPVAAKR